MHFYRTKKAGWLWLWLLSVLLLLNTSVFAEDSDSGNEDYQYQEETEYVPEAYYYPIESNDVPGWPQGSAVQAAGAIVMDMDTQAILYAKQIYDKHYPASITKIMTTLVAIEQGNLDDTVVCTEEIYNIDADSSHAGMHDGEELRLIDALYGLMHESANDLGVAIAIHIGGSLSGFSDLMNEKAASLGCVNTHFTNPHGLHSEDHYTCAYDMALISRAAYNNPVFREIVSAPESSIPPTNKTEETRYFANHHRMLQESSEYYRSWCTGGKTGYTSDSWNTLVTYGEKDGKRLVCVLLRDNGAARAYDETSDLMNYGFDEFEHVSVRTDGNAPTFYQMLRLDVPDPLHIYNRTPELRKKAVTQRERAQLTLPVGADRASISSKAVRGDLGTLCYLYNGWFTGTGKVDFTPIPTGVTYTYGNAEGKNSTVVHNNTAEQGAENTQENIRKNSQVQEVFDTAERARENVVSFIQDAKEKASDYVDNNRMGVIVVAGFVLLVVILLIVILSLRVTRDARIRRRRQQEERIRQRREAEIELQTTEQIESELREAMEKENARREEERKKLEQQIVEESKLREAEEFVRNLEKH